ncbi:MAG: hypothetical protein ACI360_08520 [Atopobiaceae bacterium]
MSDAELQREIDRLGDVMYEKAPGHTRWLQGFPGANRQDHDEYVKASDERRTLVSEQNRRLDAATAARLQAGIESHVSGAFVNSFGEATHRVITNATYERAQRSQEKRIMSLLGRR